MLVQHRFDVTAPCPKGGQTNYRVTMTLEDVTSDFPLVEDIDVWLDELLAQPIFQEDLTRQLAVRFRASVMTEGQHGRFLTRCEATA